MIQIDNVFKIYAAQTGAYHALRDVSLGIERGEVFCIIGRSGAGKSTLLRMMNLLERPSSGSVRVGGQDIALHDREQLRLLRQRVGFVFQHFNLLEAQTVADNVRLPLRVAAKLSKSEQRRRVSEVLEWVGIADQGAKYPRGLSGGQRQRVGIARALACGPEVLLCDEATSALDPQTTQSILQLLLKINRELGITIVAVTHSMSVVRTIADRVAVFDDGRLVELGAVLDVFLNPQHAVTRALLTESGFETEDTAPHDAASAGRIVRLTYHGDVAREALLCRISREAGVDLVVLEASAGRFKNTPYGQFTLDVQNATDARFAQLLERCAALGIRHQVLN